jgi:hypothetical protein
MIKDFSNPHGMIEPSRSEEFDPVSGYKYRVVRVQGVHYVEQSLETEDNWFRSVSTLDGKVHGYQTIDEAEYLMSQLKSKTIHYYYE